MRCNELEEGVLRCSGGVGNDAMAPTPAEAVDVGDAAGDQAL